MSRNPDIDHQPTTPDDDKEVPVRLPPDQPGRREDDQPDPPPVVDPPIPGRRDEDEPDPPPLGDPPNDEPIRILSNVLV